MTSPQSLLIAGGTVIDGVSDTPLRGHSIWIQGDRITAVAPAAELAPPPDTPVIDAAGKFIIPGLMDANVHLLLDMRLENLVRHEHRYEDLIAEAAQVALKNGLTTVFDTWGPRRHLVAVRERINAAQIPGSRIFCAGNIVGLGGPFSEDFLPKAAEIASRALVERINAIWQETVGPELTWMTPAKVGEAVRAYTGMDIDFVKYAGSEHRVPIGASAFLAFSPAVQAAIVAAAHDAGLTAQAHIQSVEALRVAVEAGVDIIQHCNITGPVAIPPETIELLVARNVASTVFPITQRRYQWFKEHGDIVTDRIFTAASVEDNVRNLIASGATLLLATDAGLLAAETATDAALGAVYTGQDNLFELGNGHFNWFKAMEEKGMPAMAGLKAATRNIAIAYGKDADLGSLTPGKLADLVILDKNPLESADNYRTIDVVIKKGQVIDRSALPLVPIQTAVPDVAPQSFRPLHKSAATGGLPSCCGF